MKKYLSLLLTFCMLLLTIPMATMTSSAEGESVEGSPIIPDTAWYDDHKEETDLYIGTAAELLGFSQLLTTQLSANNDNSDLDTVDASMKIFVGKTIHITADIDLNPGWTASETTAPVNVWEDVAYKCFTGMIDGGGHTISGIYLNSTTANHTGIFGNAKGGTAEVPVGVKNLAIVNSYVASKYNIFGGLFGGVPYSEANKGRYVLIENVYTDITMVTTYGLNDWKNDAGTGGIIGYVSPGNTLTIRNTVVNGSIRTTSNDTHLRPMGGFVGNIDGSTAIIEDCLFTGTVKSGQNQVAAFVGLTQNNGKVTINRCIEVGDIYPSYTSTDFNGHGSICGILNGFGSSISNCIYTDVYLGTGVNDEVLGFKLGHNLYGETNSADKLVEGTTNVNNTYISDSDAGTKLTGLAAVEQLEKAQMTATWTPTTTGLPLPRSIVTSGLVLPARNDEAAIPVTKLVGYQVTDTVDGKFDLRLVATLKLPEGKTLADFTAVGFQVVANYGETTKMKDFSTESVYSSILGYTKGDTIVNSYTAEVLGGNYLFVLPCRNVPANSGTVTMEVTTYFRTSDGVTFGATQTFTVDPSTFELL